MSPSKFEGSILPSLEELISLNFSQAIKKQDMFLAFKYNAHTLTQEKPNSPEDRHACLRQSGNQQSNGDSRLGNLKRDNKKSERRFSLSKRP